MVRKSRHVSEMVDDVRQKTCMQITTIAVWCCAVNDNTYISIINAKQSSLIQDYILHFLK